MSNNAASQHRSYSCRSGEYIIGIILFPASKYVNRLPWGVAHSVICPFPVLARLALIRQAWEFVPIIHRRSCWFIGNQCISNDLLQNKNILMLRLNEWRSSWTCRDNVSGAWQVSSIAIITITMGIWGKLWHVSINFYWLMAPTAATIWLHRVENALILLLMHFIHSFIEISFDKEGIIVIVANLSFGESSAI